MFNLQLHVIKFMMVRYFSGNKLKTYLHAFLGRKITNKFIMIQIKGWGEKILHISVKNELGRIEDQKL